MKPLIILDMANNHMGDVEHGLRIVREFAGVVRGFPFEFAFKLQYRDLDTFIHPAFRGRDDVKHVKRFQETRLRDEDFARIKAAMVENGFKTACTPFDEVSVGKVVEHGFDYLKIASCSFTDWPLLERIATVDLPIIASTAGASLEDVDRVVSFFEHRRKSLSLLHCVARYPTNAQDMQLHQIEILRHRYPRLSVGFSTHEDPIECDAVMVAVGKGATIFERHVALPTERYLQNAYSSTPGQLRRWLYAIQEALLLCGETAGRCAPAPEESVALLGLRRGVFARRGMSAGERMDRDDFFLAIPASDGQLLANDLSKYSVFTLTQDIAASAPVLIADLSQVDHQATVRAIIEDVQQYLRENHVTLPTSCADLQISHHYGLERFREHGVVALVFVNRSYCKKLLVMLPGQRHPEHLHRQKEETFYVVAGEMTLVLDGAEKLYRAGDMVLVGPGVRHSFATDGGVIFEEISSTHSAEDSFYTDPAIMQNKSRKTLLTYWMGG